MVASLELPAYRDEAETFLGELDREFYLHFSGQRDDYGIEAIYERHASLFRRDAVDALREQGTRPLLEFAVHGLIGRETKAEAAELARREAALEIEVDGRQVPYREASVVQANERDPERRATIDRARNEALDEHLNPLLIELLERGRALTTELGWSSTVAMCEELSGIDLRSLGRQAAAFLEATEDRYEPLVAPRLEQQLGFGFERLRRADLTASSGRPRWTAGSRRRGSSPASSTPSREWASTSSRSRASCSTPISGPRSRRALSVRRCACRTRSTW